MRPRFKSAAQNKNFMALKVDNDDQCDQIGLFLKRLVVQSFLQK